MIEVENVSKRFGQAIAVRDVSFTVASGEIMGLLGLNGAGKTTTMRILAGYFPPTGGTARVGGLDVFLNSLAVRQKIGYLPENVPLYQEMTVREYLNFVVEIKGVSRSRRKSETDRVIKDCDLENVRDRFISKLSKGYRQRTGLAQALIGDPEVLIMDEPTIGLDPKQIHEIRTLIKSMAGQKTIILSTHILPEVAMICDRVAIISHGRVLAQDTPQNLIKGMSEAGKIRLRVSGPSIDIKTMLLDLPAVREVTSFPDSNILLLDANQEICPQIARNIAESGWQLHEMTPINADLEDVFIRLVTADQEGAADE